MIQKNKKLKMILLAFGLLVIGIIGTVVAFLTDADTRSNVVTIGNIDLKLTEEHFPTEPPVITPGTIIEKDPVLSSTGSHDEYVFMEVTVPKYQVTLLYEQNEYYEDGNGSYILYTGDENSIIQSGDKYYTATKTYDGNYTLGAEITVEDGTTLTESGKLSLHYEGEKRSDKAYQEIFRILADNSSDRVEISIDENNTELTEFLYHKGNDSTKGWVFLGVSEDTNTGRKYVFGYNTKLNAKDGDTIDETVSLFDQIQLKSFIDEELLGKLQQDGTYAGKNVTVNVAAFGIQADNLDLTISNTYLTDTELRSVYKVLNTKLGR